MTSYDYSNHPKTDGWVPASKESFEEIKALTVKYVKITNVLKEKEQQLAEDKEHLSQLENDERTFRLENTKDR